MRTTAYDERLDAAGAVRPHCRSYGDWLAAQPVERIASKRAEADALFHRLGIRFAVYGENDGAERLIQFDLAPRRLSRTKGRISRQDYASACGHSTPS